MADQRIPDYPDTLRFHFPREATCNYKGWRLVVVKMENGYHPGAAQLHDDGDISGLQRYPTEDEAFKALVTEIDSLEARDAAAH